MEWAALPLHRLAVGVQADDAAEPERQQTESVLAHRPIRLPLFLNLEWVAVGVEADDGAELERQQTLGDLGFVAHHHQN